MTAPAAAIVTGGAGHLGRAIAHQLVERGMRVVVLDRDGPALISLAAAAPGIDVWSCDLTDPEAAASGIAGAWERAGPIGVLVNAVGRIHSAPLVNVLGTGDRRHSFEAWRETIDANLNAVFLATVNQVDRMVATRTRGVVVTLGSVAAVGHAGQGAYAAAKAGVVALTRAWAQELGALGIRFVAVAPGFIDTPSTREAMTDGTLKAYVARTPLRRLGTPAEVAAAVLFAIDSAWLTGRTIELDGGVSV